MTPEDQLLWERAFKKWDQFDEKLDGLSERTTKVESALNSHLDAQEKRAIRKEKVFYIIIAAIGASIGIFEYLK